MFKPYTEETTVQVEDEYQKVIDVLKSSTALFNSEIADMCGVSNKRVSSMPFQLVNEKEPVVHKAGWRRRKEDRSELMFKNGYLYYTRLGRKEKLKKL